MPQIQQINESSDKRQVICDSSDALKLLYKSVTFLGANVWISLTVADLQQ